MYGRNDKMHCMVTYMLSTVCGIMNFEPFKDKCPRLYVKKSNAFRISLHLYTSVAFAATRKFCELVALTVTFQTECSGH